MKSYAGSDIVTLGFMDEREEEIVIPIGTHAVIIGEFVRPWEKMDKVPIISCEYGVGWLFPDEIVVIDGSTKGG